MNYRREKQKMAAMDAMFEKTISGRKAQEQKVMDFLRENADSIMDLSVSEIAEGAGVSSPTVVRFCKSLGYEGLKDFKLNFQAENRKAQQISEPITWETPDEELRTLMKEKSVYSVQSLFTAENMEAASVIAEAVMNADNTEIIGMGGSGIIAEYLFKELLRYGKKVSLFSDPYMMVHNTVGRAEGDVCIAVSCSGTNKDVLNAVVSAKSQGKRIFSITNNGDSPLAQMSEAFIKSAVITGFKDEGNSFSRLGQFAAVNTIALMTALWLGNSQEEYKLNFMERSNYQNYISGDKDVH